jgi:hypothetical protein
MATEYTLEFLARQNAQILAALADMRDNNVAVTGMLTRIEARLVAVETRMASLARQIDRFTARLKFARP